MNDQPAGRAAKLQSLREWETLIKRYPASPMGLGWQCLTVLAGNLTIAWLVANDRMSPLELVLLVAMEAVLLVGVALLQSRFVPKSALEKNPMTIGQRLGTLAFGLFWLSAVYLMFLGAVLRQGDEVERLFADPLAFVLGSNLKWPLLITLAGAFVDALQDHVHFRRQGGMFLSTPGFNGAARWLTLFLGGIPFFMPVVAVVFGLAFLGKQAAEWTRRRTNPNAQALAITLMAPILPVAFFATFAWLVSAEQSGWAVGYATAKFAAEILIVMLPLIARKAHAEESAALDAPVVARKKKR